MSDPEILVQRALPGIPLDSDPEVPQAWKFWQSDGIRWAVFLAVGEHLSDVDQDGIRKARNAGFTPVIVAADYSGIRAIAPLYRKLRAHTICEASGEPVLIPPPLRLPRRRSALDPPVTRVSPDLVHDVVATKGLDGRVLDIHADLDRRYRRLAPRPHRNTDVAEERILLQYAERMLDWIGLRKERVRATRMLRTIEKGGLGGDRDHFFHSFQNYFLGLRAVLALPSEFRAFRVRAQLNWNVDPVHVWFLTALWHDVGYTIQRIDDYLDSAFGEAEDDGADILKDRFLARPATEDAIRTVSSLLRRLLFIPRPRSGWMPPGPKAKLGNEGERLRDAIRENVLASHGAASAVRLYLDHIDDLNEMDPDARELLCQTVYLACCSIPFHDWSFRAAVRTHCGACRINPLVLPFGALLTFVDSIQDDRRNVDGARDAVLVLRRLLIRKPATIAADIDFTAIADHALIGKIVEARDIVGSFEQNPAGLYFQYPKWMAGQE